MLSQNRRRRYWINPGFQGRYLLQILLLELLTAAVTAIATLALALVLISPGFQVGDAWIRILAGFAVVVGLVGAVLVYLGIRVSHRICGPVYRIHKVLRAIRAGDSAIAIQLRKHDELQELAEDINQTIAFVRGDTGGPIATSDATPAADTDHFSG